jgi:hypothetical protein
MTVVGLSRATCAENATRRQKTQEETEETMRKLLLAAVGAVAFASTALAMPNLSPSARGALDDQGVTPVQFRFEGHRHCWYARGWNGPGWYWCGYHHRRGMGWGGGEGWNGWRHR